LNTIEFALTSCSQLRYDIERAEEEIAREETEKVALVSSYEEKLATLSTTMITISASLEQEKQVSSDLAQANIEFKAQIETLSRAVEDARNNHKDSTTVVQDEALVNELRSQVEKLDNTNSTLTSSNDSLKQAMEELKIELEQEREDFRKQKQSKCKIASLYLIYLSFLVPAGEEVEFLRGECQRIQQERNELHDRLSQLSSDYEAAKSSLHDVSEVLATHRQERLQEVLQYGEDRKKLIEEVEKQRESYTLLEEQFISQKYTFSS
jgi:chromosome segregation ATPase